MHYRGRVDRDAGVRSRRNQERDGHKLVDTVHKDIDDLRIARHQFKSGCNHILVDTSSVAGTRNSRLLPDVCALSSPNVFVP